MALREARRMTKEKTTPPCLRLKAIRERAGVTARQAAAQCGMKAESTWFRYEEIGRMGERPIPARIITKVAPLLVGRGSPKVTYDELIAVSDAAVLTARRPHPTSLSQQVGVVAPTYKPSVDHTSPFMLVKFRAESGVFMGTKTLLVRTFGQAPIGPAEDIKGEQFCVLVADGHAEPSYPQGTLLHCASASAFSPNQVVGRRVILMLRQGELSQVVLAHADRMDGNELIYKTMEDGEPVEGELIGVVVGKYARE